MCVYKKLQSATNSYRKHFNIFFKIITQSCICMLCGIRKKKNDGNLVGTYIDHDSWYFLKVNYYQNSDCILITKNNQTFFGKF